jgi:hypothetical protein
VIARFADCRDAPPRDGGAFVECRDGALRIGWGLGEFLQLRVGRPGSRLDDECAHALDDGSPVTLTREELGDLVGRTIDLDVLRDYWHPELEGRQPLRVLRSELLGVEPALRKFGAPVEWIDRAEPGTAYLQFTSVASTATRTTIEVKYDVEGVTATAVYVRRHGAWALEDQRVLER